MADISKIKLPDGTTYNIKDTNTTYTLSVSGNNIVLTPSSGSANTITVPYATSAGSAGNASVANKLGSSNVGGGDQPIYLNGGTPTACNYRIPEVRQYVNEIPSSSKYYPILTAYNDTSRSSDTEVNYVNKQLDLLYDPKLKKLSSGQIVTELAAVGNITDGYATISPTQSYLPNEIITGNVNCSSMSVADISDQYTIKKSSGNWSATSIVAQRTGNVIQLRVVFKGNGSSVSSGGNAFVGTITGPLPVYTLFSAGYYGSVSLVLQFTSNGAVNIRVCGGSVALPSTTETYFSLTFITDD